MSQHTGPSLIINVSVSNLIDFEATSRVYVDCDRWPLARCNVDLRLLGPHRISLAACIGLYCIRWKFNSVIWKSMCGRTWISLVKINSNIGWYFWINLIYRVFQKMDNKLKHFLACTCRTRSETCSQTNRKLLVECRHTFVTSLRCGSEERSLYVKRKGDCVRTTTRFLLHFHFVLHAGRTAIDLSALDLTEVVNIML